MQVICWSGTLPQPVAGVTSAMRICSMNTDNPVNQRPDRAAGKGGGAPDTERLRQDASAVAETAKRDLEKLRGEAESSMHEIKEQAQAQLGQATEKLKSMAGEQKNTLADQLGSVASAVSRVAEELRGEQATTASYFSSLAGGMRRLSENVRERDVDELVAMAQDFGRRQPATFFGAAALAGFAASRFLFASGRRGEAQRGGATEQAADFGSASPSYPDGGQTVGREPIEGTIR
jgi:F0F1-type ATP synthase membrane subunit b/b'